MRRTLWYGKHLIGYPFWQDVYIIDHARGQDGWILAEFSFCVFMDRDEVEVHKNAKREQGQYLAILTELARSIKDLLYGIKSRFSYSFIFERWRGNQLDATVMARAPTSWLDQCRKYNHLTGYISNFTINFQIQNKLLCLPVFVAKRIF